MLSGIGSGPELQRLGIEVKSDLAGVGKKLTGSPPGSSSF
jgi:hypothetical protein